MSRVDATKRRSRLPISGFDPEKVLVGSIKPTIVERVELPQREERTAHTPAPYRDNLSVARYLKSFRPDGTIWLHQTKALALIDEGKDVLITTGTGSGKSLVFQLPLLRELAEGDGTALVFYPQKALCSDQLGRWREMLRKANLPQDLVGEVTGDTPMAEREEILAKSRVLLVTPDITHAWLARLQSAPEIRRFLGRMRFMVLDEAHALDGVFGSNSAYLFRRLRLAIELASGGSRGEPQFIAASATIGNPVEHLSQLTGRQFELVSEEENGAPGRGMTLLHIEGPDRGSASETMLTETLEKLVEVIGEESLVAFVDSRQAVERITRKLSGDQVLPYRSGYEADDRRSIEQALAAGTLRGCVSTSALELGIDIAGFRLGFNLGIPATRKSLRQRAGRVGRANAGVFAVIAPRNAFTRLGTTLEEYVTGPVESGHLYLENQAVQFQQACCLHNETGGSAINSADWPSGFTEMREFLKPGAHLPREIEKIAQSVSGSPHHSFPLRQLADTRIVIRLARDRSEVIGNIALEKALREAYPGATYLHFRKMYRVVEWRVSSFERSILVERINGGPRSVPMLAARVEVPVEAATLLSDCVLESDRGSLAERYLRITETVHGYVVGRKQLPYSTLSRTDPRLCSKYRQFESTGVMIRIAEPWFEGSGAGKAETRKRVATALRAILLVEQGVLPSEIGQTHTGISIGSVTGRIELDNAIVIFDDMQGGLRLTEPLFSNFTGLLERLRRANEMAGEESLLDLVTVERLEAWFLSLSAAAGLTVSQSDPRIFAPGSELGAFIKGQVVPRCITGHQFMCISGAEQLMYSYALEGGGIGWVSSDSLRPLGQNWSYLPQIGESQGEVLQ